MATSKNYKLPSGFDDGKSYENWKNEVEMWKRVKDLDEKKQALAVFDLALDLVLALSLKGRARDIDLEIAADDVDKVNGMAPWIQELDKVFMRDKRSGLMKLKRISRKDDIPWVNILWTKNRNRAERFGEII